MVLALEQQENLAQRDLIVSVNAGVRSRVKKLHLSGFSRSDLKELLSFLKTHSEIEQFLENVTFPRQLIEDKINEIKKKTKRQLQVEKLEMLPPKIQIKEKK